MPSQQPEDKKPDASQTSPDTQFQSAPTLPVAPQEKIEGATQRENGNDTVGEPKATVRELHWLEKLNICGQIALVIVGVIAACIYGRQLSIMKGQLREQRREHIVSQRPWVGIYEPVIKLTKDRWFIDFQLKNFGISPSLYTAAGADRAYPPITGGELENRIEQGCTVADDISAAPAHVERHGYTIFPGEPITYEPGLTIDKSRQGTVYLFGCIAYLDQFTDAQRGPVHHTRFCYYAEAPLTDGKNLTDCFGGQEAN